MATTLEFNVIGVDKASSTFSAVGDSAKASSQKIVEASKEAGGGLDSIAEGSDNVASKGAQAAGALSGLGSVVGGPIGGAMVGVGSAMQIAADAGDLLNAAVEGGRLALEAFKNSTIVTTVVEKAATAGKIASAAAAGAVAAASGVATAAQWAWNAAMTANPIGLIVAGIALLIAGIVLLVKHWSSVKSAAVDAWDGIKGAWNGAVSFFEGIGNSIKGAFKGAFNAVAGWWNHGPGSLSWTVPSWLPGIGGHTLSVPNIPMLATGGTIAQPGWAVVGERGPEWAWMPQGAGVLPHGVQPPAAGSSDSGAVVAELQALREAIVQHGVQVASGVLAVSDRAAAGMRRTQGRWA
ncbi:MAG: hypothetical protein FWF90_05050 [Promicromonosporaceae bacterium]|nr:hypothetical protein [Promicromonosporaceae bacterium]